MILFFYFPGFDISYKFSPLNRSLHFMQIVETICMKCQILFSGEHKKNIINLSMETLCWKCQIMFFGTDKENIINLSIFFLIFPRQQDLPFQANCLHQWRQFAWNVQNPGRQFAWNVKSFLLGKIKNNINLPSVEFAQSGVKDNWNAWSI